MKYEVIHVDTCLPDYWAGHHELHLSIPVYKGMSLKSIKESLHSELNEGCVCGGHDSPLIVDYDLTEQGYKKLRAAINRIKPAIKGQRKLFNDLESNDSDDYESVNAYFIFREC